MNILLLLLLLDPPPLKERRVLCKQLRPSVCLSVRDKSPHTSHHQISKLFGIKLACNESRKVTADFSKKKNWPKMVNIDPKMRFYAIIVFAKFKYVERRNALYLCILYQIASGHPKSEFEERKGIKVSHPERPNFRPD